MGGAAGGEEPVRPTCRSRSSTRLHRRWVMFLRGLTDADCARAYVHPELGHVTLDEAIALYAWHCRHHGGHIRQGLGIEGLAIADCGLRIADCGLGIADWGLRIGMMPEAIRARRRGSARCGAIAAKPGRCLECLGRTCRVGRVGSALTIPGRLRRCRTRHECDDGTHRRSTRPCRSCPSRSRRAARSRGCWPAGSTASRA